MMENIGKVKIEGKTLTEYLQKHLIQIIIKVYKKEILKMMVVKKYILKKYLKDLKIKHIMKCLKNILKLRMQ